MARATIITDVWDVMYNHLQTGTYAISTDNIFSAYNSTLARDKGYPLVIIFPPATSIDKESINNQVTRSEIDWTIEVYHTSAASVKALADEVRNKIYTGRKVFEAQRLMRINFDANGYDMWEDGSKKIHMITLTLSAVYAEG